MPEIYQLTTIVKDSDPSIWRRILVSADSTLDNLHRVLEIVFGLDSADYHRFVIGFSMYGGYSFIQPFSLPFLRPKDDRIVKLSQVLKKPGTTFVHEYCFGHHRWLHGIQFEEIHPNSAKSQYPLCVEGEMSHPPVDCGGMSNYQQIVGAIQNRRHPDRKLLLDRFGKNFDPNKFDARRVNAQLRQLETTTANALR